jgi:hypothetical protein
MASQRFLVVAAVFLASSCFTPPPEKCGPSNWTTLSTNVGSRSHGGMVFDPTGGKLIHLGGISTSSNPVAETWEY